MRWRARSVLFEGQCAMQEKFRRLINNATEPANGMHFWFNAADAGVSLLDIAKGFTTSAEF